MKKDKYILKGKKVVAVDLMTWAKWIEKPVNKIIRQDVLVNGKFVSTVFLGIDHNFGVGKPLLFETMVFSEKGNFRDLDMDRYSTWDEASKGHEKMVKRWNKKK